MSEGVLRLFDLRRIRPLDAAIIVATVLVVGLGAYLGYSMWSNSRQVAASAPATRTVQDLVNLVRKNPDNLGARMRLAQALALTGQRDEAIRQFKTILKVDKDYAPAIAGLGLVALQDKQYKVSESYYRRAIVLFTKESAGTQNTNLEKAYFYLATALMEQKEYEEAAGYFKESLRIERDSSVTHYLLAVCLREMGLEAAYKESLGNALLFDPRHPEANYDMGKVLLKEGDRASAAEHFRTSADAAPNIVLPKRALEEFGTAEERIAESRRLLKMDVGKALVEARIAVALEPRTPETLVVMGDAYARAGNEAKAKDAFERALGIDPDNNAAKAGLERVDDGS